ncbi:MAG TPA: hypothetical protein VJZ78_00585 [Anaerolineales bacterium]|nr:hypothetical protein [Anaerolineales bacterium]
MRDVWSLLVGETYRGACRNSGGQTASVPPRVTVLGAQPTSTNARVIRIIGRMDDPGLIFIGSLPGI